MEILCLYTMRIALERTERIVNLDVREENVIPLDLQFVQVNALVKDFQK